LIDFERYPVGIEPYDNVLKEFDLPDVKSSVKMFYSINELGREQSTKQIGAIIDRNNKLSGQTEEMKNKDRIGIAAMYSVIPMFLGVLKIIVDNDFSVYIFNFGGGEMKELLSEAGQCLVYGIIFVLLIMGFYGIFESVTV